MVFCAQAHRVFHGNDQPEKLLASAVGNLAEIADLVASKLPGIPVLIHGYDYACPSGKDFYGLGQWLQYPMDTAKIKRSIQQGVVNDLLDTFAEKLNEVAKDCKNIHAVNCLGTLKSEEWANELHPVRSGFNKLAKKWSPVLQATGLIP
jgi:hypothetical protein